MSLASEQADGVAGLPFYGLYPRSKSTECPLPHSYSYSNLSFKDLLYQESQVHVKMGKGQNCFNDRINTIKVHPHSFMSI